MVLIASISIVWLNLFSFSSEWVTLGESTTISEGWPEISRTFPSWNMIQALIIPGFAVAFIGSLELIVTLRNRQEQLHLRAELGSQGIANLAGSFFGAFPASTSLTRSVLLDIGGAKTLWAPFFAAIALLPIIFFGAESIRNIPQPVISGLLIATALSMLKPHAIRQMLKVNAQTRTLFLVTIISTLVLNFHEAILLGAALGIVLFLFQTSQTNFSVYNVDDSGHLHLSKELNKSSALIQISGSLYFAAARQLPERLEPLLSNEIQTLYLDLSHAHHCRVAAVQALLRFSEQCIFQNIQVEITGASKELKNLTHTMGVRLPWSDQEIALQMTKAGIAE
jgi:SulP family sulfate permease